MSKKTYSIFFIFILQFFILAPRVLHALSVTYSIQSDNQDAWSGEAHTGNPLHEVRLSGYNTTNERMEFVSNDSDAESAGMQFAVSIPKDATIQNAYITVKAGSFQNTSPTGGMRIHLYNTGNTEPFTNGFLGDLVGHHPTYTQTILWNANTPWTNGSLQQTPDISSFVQTFVTRSDYVPGNSIGFAITEGTIASGTYYGWYDYASGDTPASLTITYSTTTTPTPTPTNTSTVTSAPSATNTPTTTLTPAPTAVPCSTGSKGDTNCDGKVDGIDYVTWLTNYNVTTTQSYTKGDFNNSGKVDGVDYVTWLTNYGFQVTPTSSPATPTPTPLVVTSQQWMQDAHDAQRTGYIPEEPTEAWNFLWSWNGADSNGGTSSHTYNAPNEARTVTGGGKLYIPYGSKGLYGITLTNNSDYWNYNPTGVRFNATPVYDPSGFVYAGASNGTLYKLNASNGSVVGTYIAGSPIQKAPLFVGTSIFVVSDDGRIHKVSTSTMTSVWVYSAGSTVATLPSYSQSRDCIIYATDDLYVHAVNNTDGTRKWRVKPTPNSTGDATKTATVTASGSPLGATFERGWPVVADATGIVLLRMQLPHQSLFEGPNGGRFGTTNSENRTWLTQNPQHKNLFALNLDNGSEKFIPAVGYGSTEDWIGTEAYGVMGTQPVVKKLANGKEVVYIPFRNGQTTPTTDFRWSGHMGEMVLDDTTVAGLVAGDMRFVKMNSYSGYGGNSPTHIIDEQTPLTVSGDSLLFAHWAASTSVKITNRADTLGLTYGSPITTSLHPPVLRSARAVSCKNTTTRWTSTCTNLNYVTDGGRYFNGPGWWAYWDVADPPGWKFDSAVSETGGSTGIGTSYSSGFLPRYTYVSGGYIIVEGNGGDIMVFRHSGQALP